MDKKKTGLMLSILGVISLVLITTGVTYAFFNYAKEGTTDNVITTGSITFLYTEVSGVGNGISIENAFPTSDEVGKVATGEGEYFDFKIVSETGNNAIPYEVTARKSKTSDDIDEYIRVYLTKGATNEEVLLDNYDNLTQTSKVSSDTYTEKTIYTDTVPANTDYEETFRLRMWLSDDADFSDGSMNNKTFTLTVNVYANAEVVSGTESLTLKQAILNEYSVIEDEPTLTDSSNNTTDVSGLYKSADTNSGAPTYYFRGNVDNTVEFAGETWKVVRINEDGTIRLIMEDGINDNATYAFNATNYIEYAQMYYSNSEVKTELENWYQANIIDTGYSDYVASGNYFCEQAKVTLSSAYLSNSGVDMLVYSSYTPNFKCETDNNGYGIINGNIGLITYDEVVYAGGYYDKTNSNYYLYDNASFWTMSPAGVAGSDDFAYAWRINSTGGLGSNYGSYIHCLRPVLNLKADTPVTLDETGTVVWKVV